MYRRDYAREDDRGDIEQFLIKARGKRRSYEQTVTERILAIAKHRRYMAIFDYIDDFINSARDNADLLGEKGRQLTVSLHSYQGDANAARRYRHNNDGNSKLYEEQAGMDP